MANKKVILKKRTQKRKRIKSMARTSARGGTLTAQANAAKLIELRAGHPQKDIEKIAGIPRGHLTRAENSKPTSIKHLIRLAEFYGVAPVSILSEDGLRSTSDLLTDLAKIRGVRVDFSNAEILSADTRQEHTESMVV